MDTAKVSCILTVILWMFSTVSGCPSNTNKNVFTNTGSSATLQYDVNLLPNDTTTYWLKDPRETPRALFKKGTTPQTLNLTFTGDMSTGDLSFRIDNVQTSDTGVYTIVVLSSYIPLLCNTVYITGRLSVPALTSNNLSPSVGESVTLTCSSSSTTVPGGLLLVYTWLVDGATNPADTRYTHSTSRAMLTVSGVQKSDGDKVFTCMAQEQGSKITSSSSSQFRITVLYGPENVRLKASPSSFTRTEDTTLAPITCKADCNPSCTTYNWTHLNSTLSTSTAVLDLGQLSRNETGLYRCTVKSSAGQTSSLDVTVVVQFAPSSTVLTGNTSILVNGINNVTLTCTTSTANPPAIISWSRNGSPIDNTNQVQETAGDYDGKISSQVLEVTPTRDDDGDVYICTASNIVNTQSPVMSQQKVLDLNYTPIISISKTQLDVTECIDGLTLTCTVSSKPVSTISWYRGQQSLSTSGSNNVKEYIITNIDRMMSEQYRCEAYNGYGDTVQEIHIVTVQCTSAPECSQIDVGVVAGINIGVLILLVIVGLGYIRFRKHCCKCRETSSRKAESHVMSESTNIYEGTTTTADSTEHVYTGLEQQSDGNTPRESSNVYQQTAIPTQPEHVYTSLN